MTAQDPAAVHLIRTVGRLYDPLVRRKKPSKPVLVDDKKFEDAINHAKALPKETLFQGFNEMHLKCACDLISYFLDVDVEKLEDAVERAQKELNFHLVHYALSVALTHRKDAIEKHILLPAGVFTQTEMYFDLREVLGEFFVQKRAANESSSKSDPLVVRQIYTGTDRDPEHKVAYFREDIGMSLHHWHWHLVYPFSNAPKSRVADQDRRGELFYYMHQQMLARFNLELFSHNLPQIKPLHSWSEPVSEAYYPKYGHLSSAYRIGSRPRYVVFKNVHRDHNNIYINDLEQYRDRLLDAIDCGEVYEMNPETKETVKKKIDITNGIDKLGNSIEAAASLSWNPSYYGERGLHNMGHMLISYSHDPDDRYQETAGPMAFTQTAHTDPIFYRWHGYLNQIFQRYKSTLPEYTIDELKFDNVEITDIKIVLLKNETKPEVNGYVLETFFEKDQVDISRALSQILIHEDPPVPQKTIFAEFIHLQHNEFKYEINVSNKSKEDKTVVVRIFIAPRDNEHGNQMDFNEQRNFFIEMDKFTYKVPANASLTIERKSTDSSVTIPFHQIFFDYDDIEDIENSLKKLNSTERSAYCGCGWPQYMLVGRGRPGDGLSCDLFVMVTDYEKDKVEGSELPSGSSETCIACKKDAISYCGKLDNKYPDLRPMGFPFDRDYVDKQKDPKPTYLDDFIKNYSNMKKVDVRIRYLEGDLRDGETLLNKAKREN